MIIPDVRGLYPFYIELAERFAEAGHHAIAFDYYGRTAGLGPRDDEFDYGPHREQVKLDQALDDLAAARRGAPPAHRGRSARHRRVLLRRIDVVRGRRQPRPRSRRRGRVSTASSTRDRFDGHGVSTQAADIRTPGARPLRRSRPGDPAGADRRVRIGALGRRSRARDPRLSRRARTPSSTGSRTSSPRSPRTPGGGSSASSPVCASRSPSRRAASIAASCASCVAIPSA